MATVGLFRAWRASLNIKRKDGGKKTYKEEVQPMERPISSQKSTIEEWKHILCNTSLLPKMADKMFETYDIM
jgi:hypothetical protein